MKYPRTPKGYRRIKVGEIIPTSKNRKDVLFYDPSYKKYEPETAMFSMAGRALTREQYGYYFVKVEKPRYKKSRKAWKEPADVIFNSIFPVEEIEREDLDGYIAALIEAKYTEAEFRKACAIMAKERTDAMGENNG